jgi:hypothetical protein
LAPHSPDLVHDAMANRFKQVRQERLLVAELQAMELPGSPQHDLLHQIVGRQRCADANWQVPAGKPRQLRHVAADKGIPRLPITGAHQGRHLLHSDLLADDVTSSVGERDRNRLEP